MSVVKHAVNPLVEQGAETIACSWISVGAAVAEGATAEHAGWIRIGVGAAHHAVITIASHHWIVGAAHGSGCRIHKLNSR